MFLNLREYHHPTDLAEALHLVARPGTRALAGGTALVGPVDTDTQALVDLSGLGLRYIRTEGGVAAAGAMTTLAGLLADPAVCMAGGGILAAAAERTGPPTLRNRATIGGALARPDRAQELVAALLALGARVVTAGPLAATWDLPEYLASRPELRRGGLVVALHIPLKPVAAALERVARTPRDTPVVAVAATLELAGGSCREVRLVAAGLAPGPVRLSAAEAALRGAALSAEACERAARAAANVAADPPSDLRGTAQYRRHLAGVLVRRALLAAAALGGERHAH